MPPEPAEDSAAFLPCPVCEYDLRGQPVDGLCSECGEPVASALRRDTLHHADPLWLRRFTLGLWLTAAGPVAAIVVLFAIRLMMRMMLTRAMNASSGVLTLAADLGLLVALAGGPWLLSSRPSPPRFDLRRSGRLAARVALVVIAALKVGVDVFWMIQIGSTTFAFSGPVPTLLRVMHFVSAVNMLLYTIVAWLTFEHTRAVLRLVPRTSLVTWMLVSEIILVTALSVLTGISFAGAFEIPVTAGQIFETLAIVLAIASLLAVTLTMMLCAAAALRLRALRRLVITQNA